MDDPAPKFITRDHRLVKRRVDPSVFNAISIAGMSSTTADEDALEDAQSKADNTGASSTTPPPPLDSKYVCIVDHVLARDAMKMPCCGRLMCTDCFSKMAEEAFDETRSLEDDDDGGVVCPSCGEPLIMDEVVPATEERDQIKELLAARKRERGA